MLIVNRKNIRSINHIIMKNFFILFIISISSHIQAQSPVLDKYLEEGLNNNLSLKQQNFSVQKSIKALEESKGLFMPNISFNATYTLAGGGRTIDFPVGDLLNPVYSTLNQLTDSNRFPTIPNVNTQLAPNNFQETLIRVVQPIFNSDIYYSYKAKKELISVQEAQKKTYEQELKKNIKTAYFQYLQTLKVMDIYDKTKVLLNEVLRVNQKLVANDKATPEIIYGAEYEISKLESDISEAHKNQQVAQAYFNFLLNRPLNSEIIADSTLLVQIAENEALTNLQNQAISQRNEFSQLKSAMNANEQSILLNKAGALPKVNAIGNVGYQGFGYKFNNEQDYWLVQFGLQWDLFKGRQNRRKIEQSVIEQDRLDTQYEELQSQVQLQVQQAYYQVEASRKSIESAQSGQISAEKNFHLTRKKYEQGQARYVELIDTRTKYTNAQISLAIAQYNYLIRKAELERAIGE